VGRRILESLPPLDNMPWNEARGPLKRFLDSIQQSEDAGTPSGFGNTTPVAVGSASATPGTGDLWAGDDHVHELAIPSAKGSLIAHDGTSASELSVGTDGHVLTADSASGDGMKWAAPETGGSILAYAALVMGED
jgi:hypothetical protein